jgi:glycosyltransferase involved in cell wall biosynthesis
VAVGAAEPRFVRAVEWCVTSLRRWGRYENEIAVITDREADCLPPAVRREATLACVDESRLRDPAHGRAGMERYLMARLRAHHILDLAAYDRVLYVDCDILAVRDVRPLLEGLDCFRYSREFQPMSAPMYSGCLTDAELADAAWRRGINSGVFGAPGAYLGECLDRWKALLDERPRAQGYDQPALNALVFRELVRARPLPAFSVGYPVLADFALHYRPQTVLLHYCGNADAKFARMGAHYEDLEAGRTPRVFEAEEERPPTASFFRLPPRDAAASDIPGATAPQPLVVAFDDDGAGVESFSLINAQWSRELQRRGHYVVPIGGDARTGVVVHHNYRSDFLGAPRVESARHVAVRTTDFGPFPRNWAAAVNERYDRLWVHSAWTREMAVAGGVEPERVRVVPHGVDPDVFRPAGPRVPLTTRKAFAFVFVGGTVARKGIDILLRAYTAAFRRQDDVCLVIKDHGANALYREGTAREEIARLAADPHAPEILHLDRHLTARQLAALYRACRVAVFPYRAEGFLIPALEALACGVPTMLPRFGPCLDFSDDATSFLVEARRIRLPVNRAFRLRLGFDVELEEVDFCEIPADALAHAMRRAYETDAESLAAMGAAGAKRVEDGFTWRHVGDHVERGLRELAP